MSKKRKVDPKREILNYFRHLKPKQFENEHLFGICEGLRMALHILAGHPMETFKHSAFPEKWGWQIREELSQGVKKEIIQISPNAPAKVIKELTRGN